MSISIEAGSENGKQRNTKLTAYTATRAIDFGIAFLLFRAGSGHFGNPYFFLRTIYDYQLLSPRIGEGLAAILPSIEIAVAICLVTSLWRTSASLLAAGMLTSFVAVQFVAWIRGLEISCGCFGPSAADTVGPATIARDAIVCGLAWTAYFLNTNRNDLS